MKKLVKTYEHAIDALRFDPAVMEKLKQEGGQEIPTCVRRETLTGDPGLPLVHISESGGSEGAKRAEILDEEAPEWLEVLQKLIKSNIKVYL